MERARPRREASRSEAEKEPSCQVMNSAKLYILRGSTLSGTTAVITNDDPSTTFGTSDLQGF